MSFVEMELNVICASVLGLIMYQLPPYRNLSSEYRYFYKLTLSLLLLFIAEASSYLPEWLPEYDNKIMLLNFFLSSIFFVQVFAHFYWFLFCLSATGASIRTMTLMKWIAGVPVFFYAFLSVINFFIPVFFNINSQAEYVRGTFFFLIIIMSHAFLFASTVVALSAAFRAKTAWRRREALALALYAVPPLIGGAVQAFSDDLPLVWPCTMISVLFVFLRMQKEQILNDELTGLNNRRARERYVTALLDGSERELTVFSLDMNHFKQINDTQGHAIGDCMLRKCSELLKKACERRRVLLAREGGDEFLIISELLADNGEKFSAEIKESFRAYSASEELGFDFSVSIGRATGRVRNTAEIEALIKAADEAMYVDKRALCAEGLS